MEVELRDGDTGAIVDPMGAWLTNLSNGDGDILFPRRNLIASDGEVKRRGGCHICLPNFGPGGESDQLWHGFGRMAEWEVADKTDSSVMLVLAHGEGDYSEMESLVTYQLGDDRIVMTLEVTNNGDSELRVAPAFHPYFMLHDEKAAYIDGKKEPLDELAETQFIRGNAHELRAAGRTLKLASDELTLWAEWTDQLGDYVCVEPSLGGFTFLKEEPMSSELLAPGNSKTYSFSITWG